MTEPSSIYSCAGMQAEFRQSEIISGFTFYDYSSAKEELTSHDMPYCILVSQDCDLLREHEKPGTLFHVLMCRARLVPEARALMPSGRDIWNPAKSNSNERYQFLQACEQDSDLTREGLPELMVDFRDIFSVTPSELSSQCAAGVARRRSTLQTPYREHFQLRVANYLARIGLPVPHKMAAPVLPG